jgi:hypothetical protein
MEYCTIKPRKKGLTRDEGCGEVRNAYRISVRKFQKSTLGRHRRRWEDIKGILEEYGVMVRIGLNWLLIESSGGVL